MARKKSYDELNEWFLSLIDSRLTELGEAKLVAREIGVRDGTLSKWRSKTQRVRSDCVDRILSIYGKIPLELLKMFPREYLHIILKANATNPKLIELFVELLKAEDQRLLKHIENQIDLLINR